MSLLSPHAEKICSRLDLARLAPRRREALAFVEDALSAGGPLLLDTGVYIHQLKGRTPASLDGLLGLRQASHSLVAVEEMLHASRVLDPADLRTRASVAAIRGVLDAIPSYCRHAPSRDVMTGAAA